MSVVPAKYVNCCCCGGILCKARPGTETEVKCGNCHAMVFYRVGDNGVLVIAISEPKKPWATMEIPTFTSPYK